MGLTLEFLSVTTEQLAVLCQSKFEDCWDLESPHFADFSLHLIPRDLDALSEVSGQLIGIPPISLRPNLDILLDEEEGGLMTVRLDWVEYLARMPEARTNEITSLWVKRLKKDHNDADLEASPEMETAVSELIRLCATARRDSLVVVHRWSQ